MSWIIQHVASQPREGGYQSASTRRAGALSPRRIRKIRGKTLDRVCPCPTYSRLFPPIPAKKCETIPSPVASVYFNQCGSSIDFDQFRVILSNSDQFRPEETQPIHPFSASLHLRAFALHLPVQRCALRGKRTELHNVSAFLHLCAPACACERPCAAKTKNSRMVHKPHISAHSNPLAPTCRKKIARRIYEIGDPLLLLSFLPIRVYSCSFVVFLLRCRSSVIGFRSGVDLWTLRS
jgi:hypothetical protein